jgi:long-subunit fatty acid transport protein
MLSTRPGLPETVTAGIAHDLTPTLRRLGDFTWMHWSTLRSPGTTFAKSAPPPISDFLDWNSAFHFAAGPEY